MHHYCLQTAYHSSTFRNGLGTRIFLPQPIFMLILITVQKSPRRRRWKADCNCPKQAASQVDGAVKLQIRVCKKCCGLWPLVLKKAKRKKPEIGLITGFFDGGECGIRTHGPLRDTAFRVPHDRPLWQLSKLVTKWFITLNMILQIGRKVNKKWRERNRKRVSWISLK